MAAAESAADIPLSFLFNTKRLNRLVEYQAENNGLGIDDMIKVLASKIWNQKKADGLEGLIQKQNEQMVLTYLLAVSINDDASFATKAALLQAIDDIKTKVKSQLKKSKDDTQKGYLLLTLERIKSPEKAKATLHEAAPLGAPIGCDLY